MDGRTDGRTNGRTRIPRVLQDFTPFGAAALLPFDYIACGRLVKKSFLVFNWGEVRLVRVTFSVSPLVRPSKLIFPISLYRKGDPSSNSRNACKNFMKETKEMENKPMCYLICV